MTRKPKRKPPSDVLFVLLDAHPELSARVQREQARRPHAQISKAGIAREILDLHVDDDLGGG